MPQPKDKDWLNGYKNKTPDTPSTTREESGVTCLNMRQGLIPLLILPRNPEIPVTTEEESGISRVP